MSEQDILASIRRLVDTEHQLRAKTEAGELDPEQEQKQLAAIEETLDQCWDLLRQRRARIDAGLPPDEVPVSPAGQVEGYLQ
ncbi:hypothetical protein BTZ20_4747 [Rhodococcus sp. MTM3W5.2]|uniref:DUF2630 family protein n=1 Tax=Rhodococcus sp. MTM3W5.2 TaxID=1805827 RepID=UPI0009797B25|nr:DUF2630 family protein [Rhodococcus sp. MTM3W5.2]AQA21453.1 hypothetical protein BTZ20_4747 [Rhodococcus sp. MTM3W5.2]